MAHVLVNAWLMASLASAHVSCGGHNADSCFKCPAAGLRPNDKLEYHCAGDCMVDSSGQFCVLSTQTNERHLAFAEELLRKYEKITRKTLLKLDQSSTGSPANLLVNMNTALTAARIMQASLKDSTDKTTDKDRLVSCGSHEALSCEACMGPEEHVGDCGGDCMHDGQICILRPAVPSYAFGGGKISFPDDDRLAFVGIPRPTVSCGGADAASCADCERVSGDAGASGCKGDCEYTVRVKGPAISRQTCIPKFETMQRLTKEAEESFQTLAKLVEHGHQILTGDMKKVDTALLSDQGLMQQFPNGGIVSVHRESDRDLDLVQGLVPKLSRLLRRAEAQLEQGVPRVTCGGAEADSCAECMPPPGTGRDLDPSYCNGDCVFAHGACLLKHPAAALLETSAQM